MQESTFYQDLVQENFERGRQEGRQEGRISIMRQVVLFFQGLGMPIAPLLKFVGITAAELDLEEQETEQD
ncbi:MAG: hypothetical protein ACPGVO_14250 [Spirulinaceae cyanobacterium]